MTSFTVWRITTVRYPWTNYETTTIYNPDFTRLRCSRRFKNVEKVTNAARFQLQCQSERQNKERRNGFVVLSENQWCAPLFVKQQQVVQEDCKLHTQRCTLMPNSKIKNSLKFTKHNTITQWWTPDSQELVLNSQNSVLAKRKGLKHFKSWL